MMDPFGAEYDDDARFKEERSRAREIRKTQWWKRKLAKGRCHYCGKAYPAKALTMDHVVPLSRGGRSTKGNLVPCCKECNTQKKHLLPMEWDAYLERVRGEG